MINKLKSPQHIFAIIALITGFIMVFVTPPIANIDESAHVRRVSEIAQLKLYSPETYTEDSFSLWAANGWMIQKNNFDNKVKWNFNDIKSIPTGQPAELQVDVKKNILSLNSPVIYLPFAIVQKVSLEVFHLPHWLQFFTLRIASLLLSVCLLAYTIKRMPEHKLLLAGIYLLPLMIFTRSGVNVDGITIGLVSLFLIEIFNAARTEKHLSVRLKALLVVLAILLAQSKGAYVPLLFAALLLPVKNFKSRKDWLITIILIIVPAVALGMGWSIFAKNEILAGVRYVTDDINEVWPDEQAKWVISNPVGFAGVLLNTVFATPFIAVSLVTLIWPQDWISVFSPVIPVLSMVILLWVIAAQEPIERPFYKTRICKIAIILLILATIGLMLTMLYVQWSNYAGNEVAGFQGRYLYPLMPLVLGFLKPARDLKNESRAIISLWILGSISSVLVIIQTTMGFY